MSNGQLDPNKLHLNYKALHIAIKDLVQQIDDISSKLKTEKMGQEKSDKEFADELRQRLMSLGEDTECQISMTEEFDPAS